MTYVYVYQAALLCVNCAENIIRDKVHAGAINSGESDDFPQGPYSEGGGESDSPQHCDHCSAFLQNPLTSDGYAYVREAAACDLNNNPTVREWLAFYKT